MSSPTVRVEKATSDLLIGPDWTLNMDICDSINTDHWQTKDVVKAVKKRLLHKSPKVQFLALTLLETMIKNCGDYVHSQVVERDILQEMIKIVRKKMLMHVHGSTREELASVCRMQRHNPSLSHSNSRDTFHFLGTDMQVREKILVLLDSWQEAFGGPGGKYPQYYWAYIELKRSGVQFPQRSAHSSLIFTPPVTHPTQVNRHPQPGYGMPNNSSLRLDEAMSSEMANLSLSDLNSIQSVAELLSDMLKAVDPNDREAVKDDIITDLVSQCRSNQKKLVQMLSSTGDEELLGQGLALNDSLQSLLAKHDAIASGSPLPAETSQSLPRPSTPAASAPVAAHRFDEEEEDDDFAQLARRNSKFKLANQGKAAESGVHPASPNHCDATTATDVTSSTEGLASTSSNALTLPDPPAPVKTVSKEEEMIDLLSITLSTNPSPPRTPVTPPSVSSQNGPHAAVSPTGQGYPYNPRPYALNQGYVPYNSYVAPWAQPQPQPQSQPQPQPQVPQYSASYPAPPWEAPSTSTPNPFMSTAYQVPVSSANPSAASPFVSSANPPGPAPVYVPKISGPQNYSSVGSRINNTSSPTHLSPASATATRPFVPTYRLFEELIELRNADGSLKTSNTSPRLSGTSSQGMIGGRK